LRSAGAEWAGARDAVIVSFVWDSDQPFDARARVETAVGVLMELCGGEANKAWFRLMSAADRADAPVETVAEAILAHVPEHPPR
jgi:AmiR/NasT family two-component response regulator